MRSSSKYPLFSNLAADAHDRFWHTAPFGDESEGWSAAGGRAVARLPSTARDPGRVKTLGREEHVERPSSSAQMSSRAMASQLGKRGSGRTRFPSVDALSEFLHDQDPNRTSRALAHCDAAIALVLTCDIGYSGIRVDRRGSHEA